MRRTLVLLLSALLVLSARVTSGQTIRSFEDLALRVNLDDALRVVDQSGKDVSGTLTQLTREALTIRTSTGNVTVSLSAIRALSLVGHALGRVALIVGAAFAGLNLIAKNRNGDAGGAAGAIGAALAGVGIGTGVGAIVPVTAATLTTPTSGLPVSTTASPFFDAIALRANLDDEVTIEDTSGQRVTGQLARLTEDAVTLRSESGERVVARAAIQRVATLRSRARTGALLGGGAGAVVGAALGCTASDKSECFDGALLLGGAGAGVGALIGTLIPQRTTIYPLTRTQIDTAVTPILGRRTAGVHIQLRW